MSVAPAGVAVVVVAVCCCCCCCWWLLLLLLLLLLLCYCCFNYAKHISRRSTVLCYDERQGLRCGTRERADPRSGHAWFSFLAMHSCFLSLMCNNGVSTCEVCNGRWCCNA